MAIHLHAAAAVLAAAFLAACAQTPAPAAPAARAPAASDLFPSRWIVQEIGGIAVVAGSAVTLVLQADGAISGSAGCNRYLGQAKLDGDRLAIAPLATTRMACSPALMDQENRYLEALGKAERLALDATGALSLFSAGAAGPTRFVPDPAAPARP